MNTLFRKLTIGVLLLRWPIFLILVLLTLFFTLRVLSLKIDPSTESLLQKNTADFFFYREFRKHFGSDSLIAIAVKTSDYLTLENLHETRTLTNVLASDARVERVTSLTNVLEVRHRILGVKVEPLIEGVLEGEKSIDEFRNETLRNPLILGNLLSRDGKVGALLVRLKGTQEDPNFLQGYVSQLRSVLKTFPWPGAEFYVAGSPVEHNDLVASIRRDQLFFIPAVSFFLILVTYLIYRNLPSVIVAMLIVFVTLLWTFGTIAFLGRSLNLVNSLLAPVVMIISVTNAIYLINLFSELRPHHPSLREAICLTIEHLGVPCFLTSATTVAGFLSLLTTQVPAVQQFGFFAALGTLYSFGIAMVLMPLLFPLLPFQPQIKADEESHFFNRVVIFYLEKIEFHLKWFLLGGAALLVVLALIGMGKVRIDTNLIRDLPRDSPLAVATRFIDKNLAGVYSLGLTIERSRPGPLVTVETMKKLDRFVRFLERQPAITKVNSLALIVKKIHEAREGSPAGFKIPDEEETLQGYLHRLAQSENPDFWSFLSRDFRRIRIEARMKAVGTTRGRAMEDRIWNYINKNWAPDYQVRMTGNVVLLGQMSEKLVANQLKSVGLAFFVILSLIALFFRSGKMGLLAAIPNLIPILGLFGFMGYAKIKLSTPTAMISSVVLGLVVDASIQFLYRFRYEFSHRKHYLQALHHTYRNVGQAMGVTTAILVFGFASSVFASFRPTIYFGLLTSLTILFAVTCTLIFLPLILILLKPFGPPQFVKFPRKQTLTPSRLSSKIVA